MKIWKDRKVYTTEFIEELALVLDPSKPRTMNQDGKPAEFKVSLLICYTLYIQVCIFPPYILIAVAIGRCINGIAKV